MTLSNARIPGNLMGLPVNNQVLHDEVDNVDIVLKMPRRRKCLIERREVSLGSVDIQAVDSI